MSSNAKNANDNATIINMLNTLAEGNKRVETAVVGLTARVGNLEASREADAKAAKDAAVVAAKAAATTAASKAAPKATKVAVEQAVMDKLRPFLKNGCCSRSLINDALKDEAGPLAIVVPQVPASVKGRCYPYVSK